MTSKDSKISPNRSLEEILPEWIDGFEYPIPDRSVLVAAVKKSTCKAFEPPLPQQLAQLALGMQETAFPITTPEDFIDKAKNCSMPNLKGFAGIESHTTMPQIGFSLRHREAEDVVMGPVMPGAVSHNKQEVPPSPQPAVVERPERVALRRILGPLGDIILDIAQQLSFPLNDPAALGAQFAAEEEIILDSRAYPLREIAARLPMELFPLTSTADVVTKVEGGDIKELRPEFLWSLLDGVRELGVRFKGSESCQRQGAQEFPMAFGGPGNAAPHNETQPPLRPEGAERLGPLGEIILDLAGQIKFPVANVSELSENFFDDDVLHIGAHQCSLKQISRRVPDTVFPLESPDDLIEKLVSLDFSSLTIERLHHLLHDELSADGMPPYGE